MIETPFGNIDIFFDSKPASVITKKSRISKEKLYPDIDYAYLISFKYISDNKEHLLTCTLNKNYSNGEIESGEHLEAKSFYVDGGKITLGCVGDFGMPEEGNLDYCGTYSENGLKIYIFPNTKSQMFTFGVSWLLNVTKDNDIQTWFASDPSTHQ